MVRIKCAIKSVLVFLELYFIAVISAQLAVSTKKRLGSTNGNSNISSTTPSISPGVNLLDNKLSVLTNQPFNEFDWKLSKIIDKGEQGNMILSPVSVKLVLGMLYLGLQGHAAEEIEKALSFNSSVRTEVIRKFSKIMQSLERSKNNEYELSIGSKLFFDLTATIQPQFQKDLNTYYQSSVQQINFKNRESSINTINSWCSAITQGKIQNLLSEDDVPDSAVMILVNAIHFRGEWKTQFPMENTVVDDFWINKNTAVKVPIMIVKDQFYYFNMAELKAHLLRLPYMGNKFAMYLIVPYDIEGLSTVSARIEPEYLSNALKNLTEVTVSLRLPKFKFDSTTILVPFLRQLGIQELFSPTANLVNIGSSPEGPLLVSSVIQKTGIEVNEKGSVAHASTVAQIVSRFGEDVHDVNATHPFIFLIADESKDTIIFTGKVTNPYADNATSETTDPLGTRFGSPDPVYGTDNVLHERFNYFDLDLLPKLIKTNHNNLVVSPASIKSALALLYEAAEGKTKTEMLKALRLPDDKTEASELLQEQQRIMKAAGANITLKFQNKIYIAQSEKLLPSYQTTVKDLYHADIESLNFANSDKTVKTVNDWVNNVTDGLISTLITKDHFDSTTKLFVINCIYFKGEWESEFDIKNTREECFYPTPGECHKTFMMTDERDVNYYYSKHIDAKIVEIPFKDSRYSVILMLPNKEDGLYQMVKDLRYQSINSLLNNMRKVDVFLWIPRFTVEFSISLSKLLQEVDVTEIFSSHANMSGMLDQNKPVWVKDIIHKAKLEINEKGAKAAAATEGQVVLLSATSIKEFKATHPFLYFIRDNKMSGFLFEGAVYVPEQASVTSQNKIITSAKPQIINKAVSRRPEGINQQFNEGYQQQAQHQQNNGPHNYYNPFNRHMAS